MPDILNDQAIRDYFFGGSMEQFLILGDGVIPTTGLPRIDYEKTMVECADSVINYVSKRAVDTRTAISLAHLEFYNIPINLLPTWISRLASLKSLRIRDGSILGIEAANAISQYCKAFDELTLYFLDGPTVDEDLATFLGALRPHTLRSFHIISQNRIGQHTFMAFNEHASSLKSLRLGTLSAAAMGCLNELANCTALEVLEIENDSSSQADLRAFRPGVLKEIATWVQNCKSLRVLSLVGVRDSLFILNDVLMCPDIHLSTLDVQFLRQFDSREADTTWAALASQQELELFSLGANLEQQELFFLSEYPSLVDSICSLKKLRTLDLKQTSVQAREVERLIESLPQLSDFGFGGELVTDAILEPLASLPQLETLTINAQSAFTKNGILKFGRALQRVGRSIQLEVLGQLRSLKFSKREWTELRNFFHDKTRGRIDIGYFNDTEEHEDDSSDYSD